ncbi:AbrB/MazE/SpoVT family DNA-binding domain-containing protein [Acidianus manzaensis]|uniref:AbrB family transcriptional regulator n=1 Tax=Acidianus manzaensis TaxID=282676 RepID=A0A1W6JYG2_9CREN|nr:AbrB/MazE/SpoVT family DNA-binding domain-containing protein [Acidianus manzaensis]ARM75309.1 AbrB family transcriptional regulator [Acidianus manzaensis]
MEVKVYKKGIIVLPSEVRKKLNITEGSVLNIEVKDDTIILKKELSLLDAWGIFEGKADATEALKILEEERRKDIEKERKGNY